MFVFSLGTCGTGGLYPSSGFPGVTGSNGLPVDGSNGVKPGTFGILVVGSPGFVGSVGWFGYLGSVIVGGVVPSGTTGTYLPKSLYTTLFSMSLSVSLTFVTSSLILSKSPVATYPGINGRSFVSFSNVVSLSFAVQPLYVTSPVALLIVAVRVNSTVVLNSGAATVPRFVVSSTSFA